LEADAQASDLHEEVLWMVQSVVPLLMSCAAFL
jgi:hypothetical protein